MRWRSRSGRESQGWYWLLLLIAVSWPALASAHGSGAPRLVNVAAGPYRLWVWSLPEPLRVGETHFSVAVDAPISTATTADSLTAELAVQLDIRALEPPHQQFTAKTNKQDRFLQTYYETDLTMPAPGQWQAEVTITGPAGVGTATFLFAVLPTQRVNWEVVIWSLAIGLAVIWGLRLNRTHATA